MYLIKEILSKKEEVKGFLFCTTTAGDVILWQSYEASIGDDGSRAIARWQLTQDEENSLLTTGQVDDWT